MIDQAVFENLLVYQEILTEKFKLEIQKEELPKILFLKNEVLARAKKDYLKKHKKYKETEESYVNNEKKINELRLERVESEEKIAQVKTQKEFEIIDKSIKSNKEREEEISTRLMEDQRLIEDLKHDIEDLELSHRHQEEEIIKEQERINQELAKIQKELEEIEAKEQTILPDISEDFRYKFERIVKNKEGKGIVAISGGYCTGCHLVLPPEYVNNVRTAETILFCPNCSRALFYNEESDYIFSLDDGVMDDDDFFNVED